MRKAGLCKLNHALKNVWTPVAKASGHGSCDGINFYNRAESPPRMLGWLPAAMKGFAE